MVGKSGKQGMVGNREQKQSMYICKYKWVYLYEIVKELKKNYINHNTSLALTTHLSALIGDILQFPKIYSNGQ